MARRFSRLGVRIWIGSVLVAMPAGCAKTAAPDEPPPASAPPRHLAATEEYMTGLDADLYLPEQPGIVPLVVMVPGGGWVTADRAGLGPLADQLADGGIAAVNATYRPASADVHLPVPVQDVLCAVGYAVQRVRAAGMDPRPVVVLGHSSGAHLAALAVLAPDRFRGECGFPPVVPDALVGLAGPYDVAALADAAMPLFGVYPEEDPAFWSEGNPMTWVAERPTVPVFVGHGEADQFVPLSFSLTFADALEQAGHPVHVERVPGADHDTIYHPDVVEGPLSTWIRSLS